MGNIVYFSHGGGPLPILGDPSHKKMVSFMKDLPNKIEKPELVIVISAHWEESIPTIIGGDHPALYYDYYGFPEEAYALEYPAPGSNEKAQKINTLFKKSGIKSEINNERGFDHGLFIPLKLMYPEADIAMTQISLVRELKPEVHISLGKAIKDLVKENVLIIGSGFSFHNMHEFDWKGTNKRDPKNDMFQDWLTDICTGNYTQEERESNLINWEKAPNARYCHPREEHLIPLHVCIGTAEDKGSIVFDDYILGKRAIGIQW